MLYHKRMSLLSIMTYEVGYSINANTEYDTPFQYYSVYPSNESRLMNQVSLYKQRTQYNYARRVYTKVITPSTRK